MAGLCEGGNEPPSSLKAVRKGEGETRCRHVAYFSRIALRGPPCLTSPSDERITTNSDIQLLSIYTSDRFVI
ncbi:hypothetical protein ANN_04984 [Periplaneta americana]|uniref:Uncharacterized protein n=1 Tax=Periplaneta americana TaxID=6978 RepID=A0ABQ8TB43_PERAM|nr:hypothetical protein ANN_04984 [Periplaneta americana]